MKHFAACLILVLAIASCKSKSKVNEDHTDYAAVGYRVATVLDYQVDGCLWMLQTEDGKKYEPQNLDEQFRKDQLKVWVKFVEQKNAITICMAGPVVKITDIKERK